MNFLDVQVWLPIVFVGLMGLAMMMYAILDGYDLGVGMLLLSGDPEQKEIMIGSIGPFWDANETWLVLGVGLLLTAFPVAHGIILTELYLPVTLMLFGLILRGVAFDFRAKAKVAQKKFWNKAFFIGSLTASFCQGYMLGSYILGFPTSLAGTAFGLLVGCCVSAGYILIGACWLIMKTEGLLQKKAILWARTTLWLACFGIALVSVASPIFSDRIYEKWFSVPEFFLLLPIPVLTAVLAVFLELTLRKLPQENDANSSLPFMIVIGMIILCFHGLAYSFFPYIIPDKMTIFEAASSTEALQFIFAGAVIVLPFLFGYTLFIYKVFKGKATTLAYECDR
ncbi:MAG TPA: cytochrome BD ubiquinol oxidase subunit II [Gammaproteobacteria bacterium]|nr:cytochrome BD ubiquinol oxidase subunit II [Gammaproteobacteria bacterium]